MSKLSVDEILISLAPDTPGNNHSARLKSYAKAAITELINSEITAVLERLLEKQAAAYWDGYKDELVYAVPISVIQAELKRVKGDK